MGNVIVMLSLLLLLINMGSFSFDPLILQLAYWHSTISYLEDSLRVRY